MVAGTQGVTWRWEVVIGPYLRWLTWCEADRRKRHAPRGRWWWWWLKRGGHACPCMSFRVRSLVGTPPHHSPVPPSSPSLLVHMSRAGFAEGCAGRTTPVVVDRWWWWVVREEGGMYVAAWSCCPSTGTKTTVLLPRSPHPSLRQPRCGAGFAVVVLGSYVNAACVAGVEIW